MNKQKTHDRSDSLEHTLSRPRYLIWAGYAVFIWSIAYMIPHLYWALGGTIGMSILKPSVAELPQWELINWVASVILTLAGLIGIALIYFWNKKPLNWALLTITWAGCSIATSHAIYGMIYRLFQINGIVELESTFNLNQHVYVLSDLLLFEPWFLIEGFLLAILGWCSLNTARGKRLWMMLCVIGVIMGIVTGLLGVKVY